MWGFLFPLGGQSLIRAYPCKSAVVLLRRPGLRGILRLAPMPGLLFIYGTLHPDHAPCVIAAAARRLTFVGRATISARLLDLGEYPGIILDDTAAPIPGELFTVPDAATLAALDAYEDFRPHDPVSSLFLRKKAIVTFDDGSEKSCWVYVWNGDEPSPSPSEQHEWDSKRGDCCSGE
jgi:gamma-glutamylcyclotransferase (GGCT)/AIG2-like uncharacterized protein YtfP